MIGLNRYIFGYAIVKLKADDISSSVTKLSAGGFSLDVLPGGEIILPLSSLTRVKKTLSDIEIIDVREGGLPIKLRELSKRWGIILSLIIITLLEFISSTVVWDVRLVGDYDKGESEALLDELSSAGLFVGASWLGFDRDAVEREVLSSSANISWLNINRRGTVAYVSIVPKVYHEEEKNPSGYSNIVATRDAVIEEILVKEGIALVEAGESVRAGQILISGVIPTDKGGGYLYAEGRVVGRFSDTVSVKIDSVTEEKMYIGEKKRDISVNFFGFDINIFKNYGNSYESCDIIEKKEDIYILGVKLPISYTVKEISEYEIQKRSLSLSEQMRLARDELSLRLEERLTDGELVSIVSSVSYTEDYYEMTASIVIRENIAKNKEFEFKAE